MLIVSTYSTIELAHKIASNLSIQTLEIKTSNFSNGEIFIEQQTIQNPHVVILFPENKNINDSLIEFILIANMCKNCKIIDAIIPYIPYSRQDKSVSMETIFKILEIFRIRKIITIDIHNPNILNKNIINIWPHEIFGDLLKDKKDVIIVAPDIGSLERSSKFAEFLNCDLIFIDKKTKTTKNIEKANMKNCIIVDDVVDTGKTINFAIEMLKQNNPKAIFACISHKTTRKIDYLTTLYTTTNEILSEKISKILWDFLFFDILEKSDLN